MEWVILTLLVLAILPAVLLGGFAGCDFEPEPVLVIPPDPPTNLTAMAVSASAIDLAWSHAETDVTFDLLRTREGEGPVVAVTAVASSPYRDTGLVEDTTYSYQVRAVKNGSSGWSDPVSATTLPALFQPTFTAVLDTNQLGVEGWCLVQRILSARLARSGTQVRITLRGSTAGPLRLNKITIAEAAAMGDPYDSAALPTVVEDEPVTLLAGEPYTTRTVAYTLDRTRPQLIAFEIGPVGNVRYVEVPLAQASMYSKPGTAEVPVPEADVADRSGYNLSVPPGSPPGTSTIYLVESIEVA